MENRFRVIDIVLSAVLVVLMCIGIGVGIFKISTDPRELTVENYEEYLSIQTTWRMSGNEIIHKIVFYPAKRIELTNVVATIYIEGKSIDSQQIEVSFSATNKEPYVYEVTFKNKQPSYSEDLFAFYKINATVISISGQISRG